MSIYCPLSIGDCPLILRDFHSHAPAQYPICMSDSPSYVRVPYVLGTIPLVRPLSIRVSPLLLRAA